MKAVVFHGIGDIRLDEVKEPRIKDEHDAIVRVTAAAICGTDLHMVRGTMPGMKPGTILGHEGVGVVEEVGKGVRNFKRGDRVVIPSTIGCGSCSYCRAGYYAQCDVANPNGPEAGTAFFGGPAESGPFDGMQAELVRVPYANIGLVKLPDEVSDEQAILLSDIYPTAWFGARLAQVRAGDVVVVLGCGPVGQFAIASAKLQGAGRVIAVDRIASRLDMARDQGAEAINFDEEDPVKVVKQLTNKIGADRVIDAVGVDAEIGAKTAKAEKKKLAEERDEIAPKQNPDGENWQPGSGPSQALLYAVEMVAKAGTIGIIGVYPKTAATYPIGKAMNKNLTIQMGNCNHRKYIPMLVELTRTGATDPRKVLTKIEPVTDAIEAYKAFDLRQPGWMKVELTPAPPVGA